MYESDFIVLFAGVSFQWPLFASCIKIFFFLACQYVFVMFNLLLVQYLCKYWCGFCLWLIDVLIS